MIDPTENEKEAMLTANERAGEYLTWLEKFNIEDFTPEEFSQLVEVIVSGYVEGMQKLAEENLKIE
jgi:uncharacterized protein (DUF3820 family)|tara:strand:- start:354 stop:551 length:198 start_codon:yes stop_codon:yes gene_type:complete